MFTHGETGALIVCGDYSGDLEAIAKVLNTFEFDQDDYKDERFVVVDGRIEIDRYGVECAGAMPYCWHKEAEEEEEDGYDPTLEEVSGAIAPLLTSGTLEVVSIRSTYGQFAELERLSIRSDGWAQTQNQTYESGKRGKRKTKNWYECSTETFEPPKQST